jgi:hypothetical protein
MGRDTDRGVEDLRQLAGVDSDFRDITGAEFSTLPPAEQIQCARAGLQNARRKFEILLSRARAENNARHIRICEESLVSLADSERRLDKIADAGG